MSILKEKLEEAVENYNKSAQQYQQLQEHLAMLRGSISTLNDLIEADATHADPDSTK